VVRNLRGELVFESRTAAACLFHRSLDNVFLNRQIRESVARLGAKLPFDLTSCPSTGLDSFDLVIAERDLLLKEPADRVIALMEAVNRNVLAPLAVLTAAELARARDREQTQANEVETLVRGKGSPGFGVVAVRNGSTVL